MTILAIIFPAVLSLWFWLLCHDMFSGGHWIAGWISLIGSAVCAGMFLSKIL